MPAEPNHSQDIETVRVLTVRIASLVIIYWRTTLRLIAIAVIVLADTARLARHGGHATRKRWACWSPCVATLPTGRPTGTTYFAAIAIDGKDKRRLPIRVRRSCRCPVWE